MERGLNCYNPHVTSRYSTRNARTMRATRMRRPDGQRSPDPSVNPLCGPSAGPLVGPVVPNG